MISRVLFLILILSGMDLYGQPSWKTFSGEELFNQLINNHLGDRSGNFWLGTDNGINVYNNDQWVPVSRIEDTEKNTRIPLGSVSQFWEDRAGNIWVACKGKLFMFDGKFWIHFRDDVFPDYTVRYLLHDSRDDIWLCSEFDESARGESLLTMAIIRGTVTRISNGGWISYGMDAGGSSYVQQGDPKQFYTGILEDRRGYIWIGTVLGLNVYTGFQWLNLKSETLPSAYVTDLLEDKKGNIWVSTSGGIACFDGTAWNIFKHRDGLGGNRIRRICEDSVGRIWASVYGNVSFLGLSCFDGKEWAHYSTGRELPAGSIITSPEDFTRSNALITRSGFALFDGSAWIVPGKDDGLEGERFYLMATDSAGNFVVATDRGLFRGDGRKFIRIVEPDFGSWEVLALLCDSRGRVWTATADDGIFLLEAGKIRRFGTSDGIPDESVREIVEDRDGRIWLVFRREVAMFEF